MAVIRAARPSFKNSHDKIAFAVHAFFLANGYALTATGPAAFSESAALSAPSTNEVGTENWNEVDGEYAFVFLNPDKGGKRVVLKCLVMNGKLAVSAITDGVSEPVNLEIDVGDYVGENGATNYSEQYKNLDKLVKKMDEEILSKLDGPSTSSKASLSSNSCLESRYALRQNNEPGVGFYEPTSPQIPPSGFVVPPVPGNPMSDLYPGPGAGMYPTGPRRGGGMLIGPDDPSWSGLFGGDPGFPGGQPNIPPGARFDPFGPPGVPGFEPNRFTRFPRRPGSNTHPDLEPMGRDPDFI
ncbi:unnamed protein product [Dovyalis caffra]|uniref:PI31 proteasome regulator N-terminal domain-containing protein n=1 Tax=Dovyalis caffra TaxID=77055 RepID=A0AAV1RYX2_9ROSI|nr:unnamed protein product [Dovyalis caffra]